MNPKKDTDLVYSTERGGRICPRCSRSMERCTCTRNEGKGKKGKGKQEHTDPNDGIVRIRREVKGRKGKGVTTVHGLVMPENELKVLASELKKKCGTGGFVKDGVIEIQGDQRDVLLAELSARGHRVKKAGG